MTASTGGTYTLVLALACPASIEVGALGIHEFEAGAYAYTGSALGSGGFARVDRHRRVAAGEHDVSHWHVDYLTGHPAVELVDVVTSPGADVECAVAARLPDGPVAGFGASACDCRSHLAGGSSVDRLRERVTSAHRAVTEE
ncbi:GIY-YIG nuclease family protein [Haloplanus sp. C73]|uniref:GIY-YIG nuclease family protein n=1 Tax=Haloplanus sp. C73 TaxID=3421641 RepID=UPI003EBC4EE5